MAPLIRVHQVAIACWTVPTPNGGDRPSTNGVCATVRRMKESPWWAEGLRDATYAPSTARASVNLPRDRARRAAALARAAGSPIAWQSSEQ